MLKISRHAEQSVVLTMPDGRTIKIKVLKTGRTKVHLGFQAPLDVRINRDEVHKAKPFADDSPYRA